jgi:hypothetical protein
MAEYSVFGPTPLTSVYSPNYNVGHDLGVGGWVANTFYTFGHEYPPESTITGVRLWVPADETIIGQSVKIGLYQKEKGSELDWNDAPSFTSLDNIRTGEAVTAFPLGTLQAGWNTLYFNAEWPLHHGALFAIGISIGDGSHYMYGESMSNDRFPSVTPYVRIAMAHDNGTLRRGMFRMGSGESNWSSGHYGIDPILKLPITEADQFHSIFSDNEPAGQEYTSLGGLGGWTASNFYSYGSTPQEGWQLVGARLWVPPPERDPATIAGSIATCGYFIQESGAITGLDSPQTVIEGIIANAVEPIWLTSGWNTVYFDTATTIPWGAGIAIGWKIGEQGNNYVACNLDNSPIQAYDGSPFFMAGVGGLPDNERRGEYSYDDNTNFSWAYQANHYGSDIIIKSPN